MQIQVQSTRFTAGAELISLLEKKLSKLDRIYDRIGRCDVTLKLEKRNDRDDCVTEVRLGLPGKDIFAMERADRFEKSIDPLVAELRQQLLKHKEKLMAHR